MSLKITDSPLSLAGGAVCWLAGWGQTTRPRDSGGFQGASTRITIAFCMLLSPPSAIYWDQRLQRCLETCLAVTFSWLALDGLPSGLDAGQNRNCRDGAGSGQTTGDEISPAKAFQARGKGGMFPGSHAFLLRRVRTQARVWLQ